MYYHSSDIRLPCGECLIPTSSGFAHAPEMQELEELFESVRPEGEMARDASSFCCASVSDLDGAGGREGLVYAVEPVGEVSWSDLAWYTEAQMALEEGDTKSAEAYAEAYWAGEPFPIADQRLPEGRCRALKIVSVAHEPDTDAMILDGVNVIESLQSRLPLPRNVLEDLLATSSKEMICRGRETENSSENPDLPDGSVALWGFGDCRDFSIMSLETLRGERLHSTVSAEAEGRIRQHPSYARYRDWALTGSMPPPIHACELPDGRIQSANRRRLLVAQDTGRPLRAWLERLNDDTTVVCYGQFEDALKEIQGRILSGPEQSMRLEHRADPQVEPGF